MIGRVRGCPGRASAALLADRAGLQAGRDRARGLVVGGAAPRPRALRPLCRRSACRSACESPASRAWPLGQKPHRAAAGGGSSVWCACRRGTPPRMQLARGATRRRSRAPRRTERPPRAAAGPPSSFLARREDRLQSARRRSAWRIGTPRPVLAARSRTAQAVAQRPSWPPRFEAACGLPLCQRHPSLASGGPQAGREATASSSPRQRSTPTLRATGTPEQALQGQRPAGGRQDSRRRSRRASVRSVAENLPAQVLGSFPAASALPSEVHVYLHW